MSPAGPRVLLSATMLRQDEKNLLAALRDAGLAAEPMLRTDLAGVVAGGSEPPAAVLVRNLSHAEAAGTARRLEAVGVPAVNTAAAIETCNDKGLQALVFARAGVPHPVSHHAYSVEQVREAVAALGHPAVVKPVSGSWGRGVTRILDEGCLEAWAAGRESADAAGRMFPVLVQEYVDKPGRDLRVIVVGGTPVAAIARVSADWRTNTHLGAVVEPIAVTSTMAALCARVIDALGPGFYGVDLIEDRATGSLRVLEVNANPEFARSSAVHGVDVAAHLAAYVAERVRSAVPAAA